MPKKTSSPQEVFKEPSPDEKPLEAIPESPEQTGPQSQASDKDLQDLRQKIQEHSLSQEVKSQAENDAKRIRDLKNEEAKLEELIRIATKHGKFEDIVKAVHVAEKANDDGFLVDALHDRIIKEGLHRKFLK